MRTFLGGNSRRAQLGLGLLAATLLASQLSGSPVVAAPTCSPSIVRAMVLVRAFKREYDAYVEQREDVHARAEWSNLVHQVILARHEGGDHLSDCHDGLTVATFNLANVWMLHEDAPELTFQQALAASTRANAEYSGKIAAAVDQAIRETGGVRISAPSAAQKSTPSPSPSLTPTPTPEELERQPKVLAFLRDERLWLIEAYQRRADRYWRAEYVKAKATVIDDYADRGAVFMPYEKTTPQDGP